MIKWAGFGKLLKLSFFGLLISFFTIFAGSSVSAIYQDNLVVKSAGSLIDSPFDDSVSVGVYSKGWLSSSQIGYSKRMYVFSNKTNEKAYVFWNNGSLYFYYYDSSDNVYIQGYSLNYALCDSFSGGSSSLSNCQVNPINNDILNNFLSSFKSSDLYGVSKGYYTNYYRIYYMNFCLNSSEYNKSLCFSTSDGLTGSLNIDRNVSFSDINNFWLESPFEGIIEGDSVELNQSQLTGNVILNQCSKRKALYWYNSQGYNKKVCFSSYYNNTDIYQGVGSQINAYALTGTDIKSVWSATSEYRREGSSGGSMGYSQWLDYWRNTYNVYKRNSDTYNNPFIGVPVSIFTQMGNLDIYGGNFDNSSIIDYCNLVLYSSDLSSVYSGINRNQICVGNGSLLDYLAGGGFPDLDDSSGSSTLNSSGQRVVGSSWVGILSGSDGTYQDGLSFQNGFFNRLSSSFRFPSNVPATGVIPSYIVIVLCALIFFRFISH